MTKRLISLLFNNSSINWILIIFNLLELISLSNRAAAYGKLPLDNFNVPCSYSDTVDLSNSTKFFNGSYLYGDIVIPNTYVGIYNYELVNNTYRISVPPHPRGCACSLTSKPCIRWCCNEGEIRIDEECKKLNDTPYTNKLLIYTEDGGNFTTDAYNYFIPQINYKPCDGMYFLDHDIPDDEYMLFENGNVMLMYNKKMIDKSQMCLGYGIWQNETDVAYLTVYVCQIPNPSNIRIILNAYAMSFSIPFMVITILVYTFIPELRNLHGKSLSCYLLGLVFGYSLMCSQVFHKQLDLLSCKIVGYVSYFSFMSAFFWLSVISFDLWWNFRGTRGRNLRDSKRFYVFSLYAWGLALISTGITMTAQLTDFVPTKYKPGIGGGDYCWLDVAENYSALTYFYGPVLIIITFNVIMFVITSLKIHHVQREVARMIAREDSRKNLRSEKDQQISSIQLFRYGLFLRLFIVMGVTWSMEIISYLIGENHIFAWFFYVIDICNAVQGFLIFALFVLKKKVKHLIFKRFKKARDINRASQYSTKTTSITLTTLSHPMTEKPLMEPKPIKE